MLQGDRGLGFFLSKKYSALILSCSCVGHILVKWVDSNTSGGGAVILTRGLAVNWSQLLSLFPFPICVVLEKDNHLIKY